MASGGGVFFVKNIYISYAFDFLTLLLKFYWLTFKKSQGSSSPRELSRDLFSTGGKRKFSIFEVFRAYLKEFSIFFHEIYLVAKSYRALTEDIKSLIISAVVSLETRLKVPIFSLYF